MHAGFWDRVVPSRIISVHNEGSGAKSDLQRKSNQNRPLPDRPQSESYSVATTTYINPKNLHERPLPERPLPERPLPERPHYVTINRISPANSITKNGSAIKPFDSQFSEADNIYEHMDNGAAQMGDTVFEES